MTPGPRTYVALLLSVVLIAVCGGLALRFS
jgi:hypothetical protein